MPPSATTETESSLQPENPHRRMHRVIYILTVVCLFAQVIEGSLIIPGVLLYWGFPQLGLSEICDEMYKIVYDDESRECENPPPLFRYEPEPWRQPSRDDRFGPVIQSAPRWDVPGYREVIERRHARQVRETGGSE